MQERPRRYVHNIPAARGLRRDGTRSERILWEQLRDRRLDGLKFRRQHAVYGFVVDFYCHELGVAVEIDGTIHDSPGHQQADSERQRELESLGICFVRVRAEAVEIAPEKVLDQLRTAIANRSPSPATQESGEGARG